MREGRACARGGTPRWGARRVCAEGVGVGVCVCVGVGVNVNGERRAGRAHALDIMDLRVLFRVLP